MPSYLVVSRHPLVLPNGRPVAPGTAFESDDDVSALVDAGHLLESPTKSKGGDKDK